MNFLMLGSIGKNEVPRYMVTIACVLFCFAILGNVPLLLTMYAYTSPGNPMIELAALTDLIGNNALLALMLFPFVLGLAVLLLCVRFIHKRNILTVFTIRKAFDWNRFWTGFGIWGSLLTLFFILSLFSENPIEWNFNPATFIGLLIVSFLILPLQTTCEEVLFRAYLFQAFGNLFNKGWISVLLTGILFGMMHYANPEVELIGKLLLVYYIITGIFLGIISAMDDGIELTMGYHAINNIFAALVVTNEWQAFQTDALYLDHSPAEFGWSNVITLLIIQPLMLLFFARKYKWNNWKERLLGNDHPNQSKTR